MLQVPSYNSWNDDKMLEATEVSGIQCMYAIKMGP